MVLPIAQRSRRAGAACIDLQPTESMDHATFDTGQWLAYCGAVPGARDGQRRSGAAGSSSGRCPATSRRSGPGRASTGGSGPPACAARCGTAGTACMGHLYPGMLDVSTDLTLLPTQLGGHIEVLEFDDLRVRVEQVTDAEVDERLALAREVFDARRLGRRGRPRWGARVSVGAGPAGRGLRPRQPGLLPPRPRRRAARTARRRDDPRRVAAHRPRHPRRRRVRAAHHRSRCSSWTGSAPAARSPRSRR